VKELGSDEPRRLCIQNCSCPCNFVVDGCDDTAKCEMALQSSTSSSTSNDRYDLLILDVMIPTKTTGKERSISNV
jgi:hypothetical protein